jgi:hypothetical protein
MSRKYRIEAFVAGEERGEGSGVSAQTKRDETAGSSALTDRYALLYPGRYRLYSRRNGRGKKGLE